MAAILQDFATDVRLRESVRREHSVMKGLLGEYHARLRAVYAPEIGR
jgi:hypothetical protein